MTMSAATPVPAGWQVSEPGDQNEGATSRDRCLVAVIAQPVWPVARPADVLYTGVRWRENRPRALAHAPASQITGGFSPGAVARALSFLGQPLSDDTDGCAAATSHAAAHPRHWGTRYAARLGGSSRRIRATGRIVKSRGTRRIRGMTIRASGVAPDPSTLVWGRGAFGW